ncbi:MAG: hypothetical protein R2939_04460 [Kofleriaceae bacterium]
MRSQWKAGLLAAAIVGGLATGCGDAPSQDQCTRLLDRLVELEVAQTGGKEVPESMKADLAKQRAALTEAVRGDFMKNCTEKAPRAVVECGLKAKSPAEFAKCDGN